MNNILEYKGYVGSVDFSSEDKIFFGKLLGVTDLVTFEGKSVSELEKGFKSQVEEYLSICKQTGKEPEKTYKGSFNVRITSELHKKAALLAQRKNLSLNELIKQALTSFVEGKSTA